jgi:two-component system sensor histidine kinase and response regulator WspE
MTARDLSQLSMHDLFRLEAENQTQAMTAGLLELERNPTAAEHLESCMRAAHSLKGAARIVDIDAGVALAHAMEDFLVAAQEGRIVLTQAHIDRLLQGVDLMMAITRMPDLELGQPAGQRRPEIDAFIASLGGALAQQTSGKPDEAGAIPGEPSVTPSEETALRLPVVDLPSPQPRESAVQQPAIPEAPAARNAPDRALRVTVENLNRLLGLAGETLVDSRWLRPFGESLVRLKKLHRECAKDIDRLRESLLQDQMNERAQTAMADAQRRILECQQFLADRLVELDASDRQSTRLAHRIYDQALACRMRPFADGIQGFPRMVRDVGRTLGKQVKLEIVGNTTQVDRDILEKLDAPLGHLLRNALDHGIETPDERLAAGKPAEGVIRLEAHHSGGALQIIVSDDGRGIDLDKLRATVVKRGLANPAIAGTLSESELLEFLFLPAFTMKTEVTEISGRGVGLDVVQDMIKQVRGVVRISSQLGSGSRFQMQLPLTLSVVRTLLVEIGGEPYAFPLAYLVRAIKLPKEKIEVLEGRQHFNFDGEQIGLVTAHQILDSGQPNLDGNELAVVVVGDQSNRYGVVVDRFLGGRELVVHTLDARFGKIKDISAAALMEDGSPVLIVDVEDMIRSMEKLAFNDRLNKVQGDTTSAGEHRRKRVLVVDDSLTVRELERKLLDKHGYNIEVAVDGMDGWNAVRSGDFDLVITDVDMPRMDGIELVKLIKKDSGLKSLPVMILSYKDREEDRRRGLEAGADYYLTKGSFHDDTLLQAVVDLIGEATT